MGGPILNPIFLLMLHLRYANAVQVVFRYVGLMGSGENENTENGTVYHPPQYPPKALTATNVLVWRHEWRSKGRK